LLTGILRFALPLIATNVLQLAFNAADMIVVGKFSGSDTALAAVGATGALINLIVNLFIGLATGVNVLIANYRGAGRTEDAQDTVHTAMVTAAVGGFALIFIGFFLSRPLLALMGTPINVIDQSTLYMRIYFMGMPFFLVYNYGAAILRGVGDTKRPLFYLSLSGVLNVLLNLFFVMILGMDVAGVALATISSQALSAILIVRCLLKTDGICNLDPKKLKIHKHKLIRMLQIGLPAGFQGSLFSISNVLIQSSVNSFGSIVMSGNTAAGNIEGFIYTSMNSVAQAALSFTGQNYGAQKYKRIDQVLGTCMLLAGFSGALLGNLAYLFGEPLLSLYTNNSLEVVYGMNRMQIIATTYFLCGLMDTLSCTMRGLGMSVLPTIISLTGACLFRILWIYTVFAAHHTQFTLYISYPISWFLTSAAYLICYFIVRKKKFAQPAPALSQ
jgi:putative MATE family efflux protein